VGNLAELRFNLKRSKLSGDKSAIAVTFRLSDIVDFASFKRIIFELKRMDCQYLMTLGHFHGGRCHYVFLALVG